MKIGKLVIYPWDRKNFFPRIIYIGLVLAWAVWCVVFYNEGARLDAQRQEREAVLEQQQMRLRFQAEYQRRLMQEESIRGGVQNAVDGFKK